MKKIIIIYLTILLSNILYSQKENLEIKDDYIPKWMKNTPGQELAKASNHYYGGFATSLLGAGLYTLGIKSSNTAQSNSKEIENIGFGIMVFGTLLMFESQIHIKRAGIILDNRGIGVNIPIGKNY